MLYSEYRRSLPRLASLNTVSSTTGDPFERALSPAACEAKVRQAAADYALSKSQNELLLEDGKLWEQLASSAESDRFTETATQLAEMLKMKSTVLSESYVRRTDAPTAQTYEECREILRNMGVPCLEATDRFEGEALAASMVINGLADYVASEDTVRCWIPFTASGMLI